MRFRSISLFGIFSLFGAQAVAAVNLDPACSSKVGTIKTPAGGSNGVLFDETCKTAYTLPPASGDATVSGLTQTANTQYCPQITNISATVNSTLASVRDLQARVDGFLADYDRLSAAVELLEDDANAKLVTQTAVGQALTNAMNQKIDLAAQLQSAQAGYDQCMTLNSAEACATLLAAMQQAEAAVEAFNASTLAPAQAAADAADAAYQNSFNAYTAQLNALTAALQPIADLQAQIDNLNTTILNAYQQYGALEGGTATLDYAVGWKKLIKQFASANPALNLSWVPVPLDGAIFSASAVINGAKTSVPAVLWARLPGDSTSGTTSDQVGLALLQRGESATATIGLSVAGICEFLPSGAANTTQPLAAHAVANLTYRYTAIVDATFADLVEKSPIVAGIRARLPKFNPLGGGRAEVLVRGVVAKQAVQANFSKWAASNAAARVRVNGAIHDLQTPMRVAFGRNGRLSARESFAGEDDFESEALAISSDVAAGPLIPVRPRFPSRPMIPVRPMAPVHPVVPMVPVVPVVPMVPVRPIVPVQPINPIRPPINPINPIRPPVVPIDPIRPPVGPVAPWRPHRPIRIPPHLIIPVAPPPPPTRTIQQSGALTFEPHS